MQSHHGNLMQHHGEPFHFLDLLSSLPFMVHICANWNIKKTTTLSSIHVCFEVKITKWITYHLHYSYMAQVSVAAYTGRKWNKREKREGEQNSISNHGHRHIYTDTAQNMGKDGWQWSPSSNFLVKGDLVVNWSMKYQWLLRCIYLTNLE